MSAFPNMDDLNVIITEGARVQRELREIQYKLTAIIEPVIESKNLHDLEKLYQLLGGIDSAFKFQCFLIRDLIQHLEKQESA